MLYSIYPVESILAEEEEPESLQLQLHNRTFLCHKKGPFFVQVQRMISSNPDDFITHPLQPGQVIDLRRW